MGWFYIKQIKKSSYLLDMFAEIVADDMMSMVCFKIILKEGKMGHEFISAEWGDRYLGVHYITLSTCIYV